jgi:hypothetical protein
MRFEVLSIAAIFVSFGTLLLVFGLDRRSVHRRFGDLSRQSMLPHNKRSGGWGMRDSVDAARATRKGCPSRAKGYSRGCGDSR